MTNSSDLYLPAFAEKVVLADITLKKGKILDYGCGSGKFTIQLFLKGLEVYGCDVDKEIIQNNNVKPVVVKYKWFPPLGNTNYPKNFFDIVCLMGVLEHVPDERSTLEEIHRILKPKGFLYIYVINKGLFSAFDSANLKFIFPTLHKWLYYILWGKKNYLKLFVNRKSENLYGDSTLGKNWHTHYSIKDVSFLTRGLFDIKGRWYYSLFLPFLLIVDALYIQLLKKRSVLLTKLIKMDNNIDSRKYSYCLIVKCQKI